METLASAFALLLVVLPAGNGGVSAQTQGVPLHTPAVPAATKRMTTYTAIVTQTEAQFEFPLSEHTEWEWHRADTRDDALEYRWSVEVAHAAGTQYELGFFLFKFPDSRAARGPLTALLSTGQTSVAMATSPTNRRVVEGESIEVRALSGRLAVVLRDGEVLRMLLRERPTHARFRVNMPGESSVERDIPVKYTDH